MLPNEVVLYGTNGIREYTSNSSQQFFSFSQLCTHTLEPRQGKVVIFWI